MAEMLRVEDLVVRFHTHQGTAHAVNGVNFTLYEGETLGIVGESGSGKSVTMLSLLGLIASPPGKVEAGRALFGGKDLLKASPEQLRQVRGAGIGIVFQDPLSSLNPLLTIGRQMTEALTLHLGMSREAARQRAIDMLGRVGISAPETRLGDYPHQFSGGMRQRVLIAMALSCSPQVLVADEPTTALDVTIQAQITDLIKRLRREMGMAIIWISHDLGVVAGLADRVLVMYGGFVVEQAPVKALYARPEHPYTRALLGCMPRAGQWNARLTNIEGSPPEGLTKPVGCPFASRCAFVFERCRAENPALLPVAEDHDVACWWDVAAGAPRHDR